MAALAIKGHATRGKEVIKILEMLGGKTRYSKFEGNKLSCGYYIKENGYIGFKHYSLFDDTTIFTLEEFLEKFPYKVGDKVYNIIDNKNQTITNLIWDSQENEVGYETDNNGNYLYVNYLQLQKKETMESKPNLLQQLKEYFDNTPRDVLEKEWNELSYLNELGPTVDEYLKCVKKYRQTNQYPKTYKECCDVLGIDTMDNDAKGYRHFLIIQFQELIIARDAYWKIAGIELGLGKSWEPDYVNPTKEIRYFIFCTGITIEKGQSLFPTNKVFIFPTEEMCDAFYENFKNLIESCKEFL